MYIASLSRPPVVVSAALRAVHSRAREPGGAAHDTCFLSVCACVFSALPVVLKPTASIFPSSHDSFQQRYVFDFRLARQGGATRARII